MASLVLKNLPDNVHRRLKEEAARNRRSMTQQATLILEQALVSLPPLKSPSPIKPRRPFTHEWLMKAMREGRE